MYIGIIGHSGEDKMNIAHLYGNTLSWILEHPGHETPTLEFIKEYYSWCESLSDNSNWIKPDLYYASFAHPLKAIVSMITGSKRLSITNTIVLIGIISNAYTNLFNTFILNLLTH